MKLKIELFRYGTLVFGKVLGQAEELRGKGKLAEHCRFEILSELYPALSPSGLYVKGTETTRDDRPFYFKYETAESAKAVCNNIVKLVTEINAEDTDLGGIVRVM